MRSKLSISQYDPRIAIDLPAVVSYSLSAQAFLFDSNLADLDGRSVIAGPCAVESEEILWRIANSLQSLGVKVLRGGSYKHRTLPYSFAGLGREGLVIHSRVARAHDMLSISEIMDTADVSFFGDYIDIVQIGARNMRNYPLLRAVAELNKPTLLKRDMSATLFEWLASAEHLLHHGLKRLALCERGVRWHDSAFRNLPDFTSMTWIKTYLDVPLFFDPSHACGRSDLIRPLSRAAAACDVDGLLIETHSDPESALCDGPQAVRVEALAEIIGDWRGRRHERCTPS